MIYLLDSNVCIDHLRKKGSGALQRKLAVVPATDIVVCSVVVAELLEGCYRSQNVEKNLRETRELLALFKSLPFNDAAAEHAATVGANLSKSGQRIDQNDLLISATALAHNLTLVTHNTSEFARVSGLRIEDWQALA